MQYINKDLGSFNLHMINTDKFKNLMNIYVNTHILFESLL